MPLEIDDESAPALKEQTLKPKTVSMVSSIAPPISIEQEQPRTALVVIFGAWSFLASLLIFWVELMVAKMLLPRFGGSASVWNTALVFFQVNLLVGYAGAHLLGRLDSGRHKAIQVTSSGNSGRGAGGACSLRPGRVR